MTLQKVQSAAREIAFGIATLLIGFNLMPDSFTDDAVAAVVALVALVWGLSNKVTDKGALGSLARKLAVAASGIAVRLEWITNEQAGAAVTVILSLVAMRFGWTAAEKNEFERARQPGPGRLP